MQELTGILLEVDKACEEKVASVGSLMVWSCRGRTRHGELAGAFPQGYILITSRALPGDSLEEEIAGVRATLPLASASGNEPATVEHCAGLTPFATGGAAPRAEVLKFERALLEHRLEPVSLRGARQLLSEISRSSLHLTLPVLVAVADTSSGGGDFALAVKRTDRLSFVGVRTRPHEKSGGLHISESIRIVRPSLAAEENIAIGDLLRHWRGISPNAEVSIHTRHDLRSSNEEHSSWSSQLPTELQPGPFISLVLTWSSSLDKLFYVPLFQTPPALACSSAVYLRCGTTPDNDLLGRCWADLERLVQLHRAEVSSCGLPSLGEEGPVDGEGLIRASLGCFIEDEARVATATSVAPSGGTVTPADLPPADTNPEEDRPNRDFVDRLWLHVATHCEGTSGLVTAIRLLMEELGRPGGFMPFVRRDNSTEMADLVRQAIKISRLRRYALADAQQLKDLSDSWDERCLLYSEPKRVLSLTLGMGLECLRRDLLHMITRCGYITAKDLGDLVEVPDESAPKSALDRLRCLCRIADLALTCSRHRICCDAMRRLVLKAAEYYQRVSNAKGLSLPVFGAQLSHASTSKLLATFPLLEPSTIIIESGKSSVRVERALAAETGRADDDREAGVWAPTSTECPFEYRVTICDRFQVGGLVKGGC